MEEVKDTLHVRKKMRKIGARAEGKKSTTRINLVPGVWGVMETEIKLDGAARSDATCCQEVTLDEARHIPNRTSVWMGKEEG